MLHQSLSFLIKCSQTGTVWLFNCPEGCQHLLINKNIKIHLITNIIITHLSIDNLAGLMGLLSSLSLSNRIEKINIYGPPGIFQYLQYSRKYSQTTFKYQLEIHTMRYGYIDQYKDHTIYAFPTNSDNNELEYSLIEKEKIGRFKSRKAHMFKIIPGPLYGLLKSHCRLLTPDGNIISGKYFTNAYAIGLKIIYLIEKYSLRSSCEIMHT